MSKKALLLFTLCLVSSVLQARAASLNAIPPTARIVALPYNYPYKIAKALTTDQFLITTASVHYNRPRRAIKIALGVSLPYMTANPTNSSINLEKANSANTVSMNKSTIPAVSTTSTEPTEIKIAANQKSPKGVDAYPFIVYFALNSDKLTWREMKKLDQFAAQLNKGTIVDVTGYTCWLGSKKYNNRLALRRAKTVANYLRRKNILVGLIRAKGKCCYIDLNHPSKNRRVEITPREQP